MKSLLSRFKNQNVPKKKTMGYVYPDSMIENARIMKEDALAKAANPSLTVFMKDALLKAAQKYDNDYRYMSLSHITLKAQPTINTIISYAEAKNIYPTEAVKAYELENTYVFYPDYIIEKAKLEGKNINDVVHDEDIQWGAGRTPIANIVQKRKNNFQNLKNAIIEKEVILVDIIIQNHVNNAGIPMPDSLVDFPNYDDDTMGGWWNDAWDSVSSWVAPVIKILTPLERLQISAFKKYVSPVIYKIVPDKYADALANLSDASAQVLVGNLSTSSLQKLTKASIRVILIPASLNSQLSLTLLEKSREIGIVDNLVNDLNKATGGVIDSFNRVEQASVDIVDDEPINYYSVALDAIKVAVFVAAVVATGGTGGAMLTAAGKRIAINIIMTKTGLSDSMATKVLGGILAAAATGNINLDNALSMEGLKAVAANMSMDFGTFTMDSTTGKLREMSETEMNGKLDEANQKLINDVDTAKNNGTLTLPVFTMPSLDLPALTLPDISMPSITPPGLPLQNLSISMDDAAKISDKLISKYGEDFYNYLFDKYGPRLNYDDVPEMALSTSDRKLLTDNYTPKSPVKASVALKKSGFNWLWVLAAGGAGYFALKE